MSQARAEFQSRTGQMCCQPGQSPGTDRAQALANQRFADKNRICFEEMQNVQLAQEGADGLVRAAENRVTAARSAIEQARAVLVEKQERLRALEAAEGR